MTPITTPPRTESSPRRAVYALAAGYFSGTALALLVVAVGRVMAFAHPPSAIWFVVGAVAGLAAVTGFLVGERATATDAATLARRFGGAMLLGGFAAVLVLVGMHLLPVLQTTASPPFLVVVGPAVGLLFFPVLLLAMGPRFAAALAPDRARMTAVAATLGAVTGWALTRGPAAPLPPAYAIAWAAILAEGLGLVAIWSCSHRLRHRSTAGLIAGVAVSTALLLAVQMGGGGTSPAIGSV